MPDVTANHEERETLVVDVTLPGHEARVTTPLFSRTREEALTACGNRCEITGEPESEVGPLELHHFWVERCLATAIDARRLQTWIKLVHAKAEAALAWFEANGTDWVDPYAFADDMTVNGLALSKRLHTGKGEGIHAMPLPLWQLWATGKEGFQFVGADKVHAEQGA